MHILSAEQFSPVDLGRIFASADALRGLDSELDTRRELAQRYIGRQVCSLFYEPSTRTRVSFEQAAIKLGAGVVSTENAGEFSSAAKGETLEDTIRVLGEYNFDAIVLRHPEAGSAQRAAAVSDVPIINAGDGQGEHPTQALLDAYTIQKHHDRLDHLTVVLGGDLKHGRTVRSLARVLNKFEGNELRFVSTPSLVIGDDIKQQLAKTGTMYNETDDMHEAFDGADVVYWTRLQKERLAEGETMTNNFVIDSPSLEFLPSDAIIMHPLPRVDEIAPSVDSDPRAVYFEQAGNGLYIRMALLDEVFDRP